ncbi:MAG: hypothetical protein H6622_16015 [Halobacteriovoraceae bacterium]|nr:hypothetical protein [Halobacteriovoraceae bacterium]
MKKKKIDVFREDSDKKGVMGYLEGLIRKFRMLSFALLLIPIGIALMFCLGVAITPVVGLIDFVYHGTKDYWKIFHYFLTAFSIGIGFYVYGLTLIVVVPIVNFLFPFKVKPWRGPWQSIETIPWLFHNALTYLVRYTFLEFITPTPFATFFYKMMGMKIGKGVHINTTNISDPCLITIEDNVTIGGSATIIGHYGQKGYLVLAPVVIKKGATVGLKSSIFGDVHVGHKANVLAHSVLFPKTRVGDEETI